MRKKPEKILCVRRCHPLFFAKKCILANIRLKLAERQRPMKKLHWVAQKRDGKCTNGLMTTILQLPCQ